MAIKRSFILSSGIGVSADNLFVVNNTNSVSSTTGSIVLSGGIGIGQSASISGRLQMFNGANYTAFVSSASGNTVYTLPATSPATGSSVLQSTSAGVMSWVPMTGTSGSSGLATTAENINTVAASTNATHYILFTPSNGGSGVAVSSDAGLFFNPGSNTLTTTTFAAGSAVNTVSASVSGSTASNTTTTGALVVTGGVGIGQSVSVGGRLQMFNGANYTAFQSSASGNTVYTFPSTSPATGSSVLQSDSAGVMSWVPMTATGGASGNTAQNIVVNSAGNASAFHPILFTPDSLSAGSAVSSDGTISFNPSTEILNVSGLAITSNTASTNSTSGALIVTGGVGIGGSLYVAGDLTINGTTTTINSVTLTVDDKNIELGSVVSPSDVTAEGGGITLRGATDKSINWYTGTGWSSSESWNLASGNTYKINNTAVISNSSIGTGITNSSLTALGTITTGTWAGSLITGLYGGTGFNSYTKGDILVGAGTTLIKHAVGSQNQILIADLFSGSGLSWATFANPTYGSFYSTSSQPVAGAGATTLATFNSTYESNRVAIIGGSGTSSRIQIQDAGPFSLTFSAQINLTSGTQPKVGDFWFRINGQDVPQSSTQMTISGKDFQTVITINFVYTFAKDDYFEIVFSSNDANYRIEALNGLTNPPRPDIPSIILSVLPVTHVVGTSGAGISGILSLNGSNSSQQYFLTGASGSGFNIQTASGNHTFNIPIAGSGATGLVTGIAQTFEGSKTFSASTIISSSTASTTTTTGALIVSGGVGIGQSVSVGGRLQLFNGANYTAFVSSATGNTVYTLPATSPATGSSVLQSTAAGVLSWVPMTATAVDSGTVATPGAQYQVAAYYHSASGASVSGSATFTNNTANSVVNISHTTLTASPASGALTVTGGVGIGSSVSILGRLQLFNSSNYTAFISSATGNTVYTLPATSPATGSSVLQSTAAGILSWVPMVAGSSSSGNTSQNVVINPAGNANVFHPVLFTPLQNSSGSAVSSDSTISFNPSTEILNVSGLAITSGTASTNTTTGALVVRGGLGVTGQLSFATASFGFTGITANPTMSFIGATSSTPITLTVLTDNSLSFEGSQGSVFSIDSNLSSGEIFSVSDISGLPIISASAGQTVNINEFGGYTQIGNGSINSSSTSTGSLVVVGGLGVTGNANIGGSVVLSSSTTSISTTTGALIVSNGVGIGGSLYVGSASRFTSSTASLNTSSGSVVVSGGVGIGGSINVGGASRFSDTTQTTSSSTGALIVNGGVGIGLSASIGGRLQLFNGSTYTAFVSAATANTVYTLPATSPAVGTSILQSTSGGVLSWISTAGLGSSSGGSLDGSVQYKSGSGFAGTRDFWYDQTYKTLRLGNFPGEELATSTSAALLIEQAIGSFNGSLNGNLIGVNARSSFTGDLINLQTNAITRFRVGADGGMGVSSLSSSGNVVISSSTNSTSTTTGALVVTGGMGIGGNAFIGGTTTITNTTASVSSSSGALVVAGGVGIGQTLFVGGNLYQNTNAITAFDTGFRNRIINGDGFIDQRSDDSSTTPGVGATTFIDRWKMNVFGSGRLTIGKNYGAISSPDGFVSYIGMKTTTTTTPGANDYNFLSQVIEGVNTIDLQWGTANAKPLALSFWAYSSLTGTFGGSVRNAGSGAYNRSYPFTYTISSSNTWEKKTVVIPGDTTGTWTTNHLNGIEIIFVVSNGTTWQATPFAWAAGNYTGPSGSLVNLIGTLNATLYLTGIQAEIGSVATPYERRNYGHEFALCQRYYQITEVRTGGYHTTGNFLRGSVFLNTAARPISSPVFTVLSTDESNNHGTLNVDNSSFRGDSFRYLVQVTTTGDAFGQWKVGADFEF